MSLSIVIAGGGTGGHVYPGLALAEAILRQRPDAALAFIGTSGGLEATAVPAAGFDLETIDVIPWSRTLGARRFLSPAVAIRAASQAARILRRRGADAVAGMGGYASLPVGLAAWRHRIPLVLHEQNAVPGRANRVAARLTRHVAVTFSESAGYFRRGVRVVGNPLRREIATMDASALRSPAAAHFGLDPARTTIVVSGGSQGARRLSQAARDLATIWGRRTDRQILLMAGRGNARPAEGSVLHEIEFTDRIDLAYAIADIVVARAGAGMMEIACAGAPAVLVPYPYARDDHQTANARAAERAGAAVVVPDAQATAERIGAEIDVIAGDPGRSAAMQAAARAFARPDAADDLAAWVVAIAQKGSR